MITHRALQLAVGEVDVATKQRGWAFCYDSQQNLTTARISPGTPKWFIAFSDARIDDAAMAVNFAFYYRHPVVFAVAIRLLTALFTSTYANPDEYWQGPEIAHKLVWGNGFRYATIVILISSCCRSLSVRCCWYIAVRGNGPLRVNSEALSTRACWRWHTRRYSCW